MKLSTLTPALSGARAIEQALGRYAKPGPKTPAGLPHGCQWKPHDTGTLGLAAARRRRQAARLHAKKGPA